MLVKLLKCPTSKIQHLLFRDPLCEMVYVTVCVCEKLLAVRTLKACGVSNLPGGNVRAVHVHCLVTNQFWQNATCEISKAPVTTCGAPVREAVLVSILLGGNVRAGHKPCLVTNQLWQI